MTKADVGTDQAVMIFMFLASMLLQVFMLSMLPLSQGYTRPWPTLAALVSMNVAIWLYARLIASGVHLSIMVPISATIIPLCSIIVGITCYGDRAPALKIALLVTATAIIGVASVV